LFGLTPPEVETASVLELGCASGGNIIPLAVRFPRARFLGFDLTQRHVDEGQARIRALGLGNIEIRQGDVTTLDLPDSSTASFVTASTAGSRRPRAKRSCASPPAV
jgi:ubiquinone/menaquinone biosynthesis C-methylase UbiE